MTLRWINLTNLKLDFQNYSSLYSSMLELTAKEIFLTCVWQRWNSMKYHAVKVGARPDMVAACMHCPQSITSSCWLGPASQNAALLVSSRCLHSIVKSWTRYSCSSIEKGSCLSYCLPASEKLKSMREKEMKMKCFLTGCNLFWQPLPLDKEPLDEGEKESEKAVLKFKKQTSWHLVPPLHGK